MQKTRNNGLGKWQCSDLGKWMGAINFRGIATKYFSSSSSSIPEFTFPPQNFTGSSSKACNTNISDFKGAPKLLFVFFFAKNKFPGSENRKPVDDSNSETKNGLSPWSSCAAAASPAQRDPFPFIPQRIIIRDFCTESLNFRARLVSRICSR